MWLRMERQILSRALSATIEFVISSSSPKLFQLARLSSSLFSPSTVHKRISFRMDGTKSVSFLKKIKRVVSSFFCSV